MGKCLFYKFSIFSCILFGFFTTGLILFSYVCTSYMFSIYQSIYLEYKLNYRLQKMRSSMTLPVLKISQYSRKQNTASWLERGKYDLTDISSVSWASKIVSYNIEYLIRTQHTNKKILDIIFPPVSCLSFNNSLHLQYSLQ